MGKIAASTPTFRTPTPIETVEIPHPDLPASLDGLRILHLADPHIRRTGPAARRLVRIVSRASADLVVTTGDWMSHPGDEPAAKRALEWTAEAWRGRCDRLGAVGVFGNHDSARFREWTINNSPVRWLNAGAVDVSGAPIRVLGASWPEDWLSAAMKEAEQHRRSEPSGEARFRLALAHTPSSFAGADLVRPHLVLAGHTHGGQVRLPGPWAPYTSSELPAGAPAGIFMRGRTICCVTRGLGNINLEMRFNCEPQIPLYVLRPGPLPEARDISGFSAVRAW